MTGLQIGIGILVLGAGAWSWSKMSGILGYWAGDTGDVEITQWLNETKHVKEWNTQVDPDESLMRSYQIEWTGEQSEKQLKSFCMQARGKSYACFSNKENHYSLYSMTHLKKIQDELSKQRARMEKNGDIASSYKGRYLEDMDEILTYLKEQPIVKEEAKETTLLDHILHAWYFTAERIDDHSTKRMMSPQINPALRWAVGLLNQSDYIAKVKEPHEWTQACEEHPNQGIYDN